MPGAINTHDNISNSINVRIAVIESNLQVSGHVCAVFHIMLEDNANHFSLVRFIPDFIELDNLFNRHFRKHRIPLPKLEDNSLSKFQYNTTSKIRTKPKMKKLFSSMKKKKSNSELLEQYLYRCIYSPIGYSSLFRDFLSAQRDEDRVISKVTVRQLVAQHHTVAQDIEVLMTSPSSITRKRSIDNNKCQESVMLPPSPPSSISIDTDIPAAMDESMTHFPEYCHDSKLNTTSSICDFDEDMICSVSINPQQPADRIDDFQLIKVLGKGATGKVILVREQSNPRNDKLFALKTITKSWNITQREVDHIRMERDILATLSQIHHPFLVRLHCAFQDCQNLYFVLDYHAGADLATLLQRYICFPPEQCRLYAAEMVMGLQELHRHHILYRDLKPENVLLAADGHIVLTDFGLSKMFDTDDKYDHRTTTFCGTPEYLAPEIILQEEEYSYAADFWSLGTMLYEMLTGVTPFAANSVDEMYDRVIHDELLFPAKFDPEAMDLIAGLLEKDPLNRLGAGFGGVFELRTHTYFSAHLNWKDVHAKRIQPIYVPMRTSETDLSNFDPDFLNMSTHIKEETDEAILLRRKYLPDSCPAGLNEDAYRGFSYIDTTNLDDIPYESEISFFSSEYMIYSEDDDIEDDYFHPNTNDERNALDDIIDDYQHHSSADEDYYNDNSVPPFLHQHAMNISSSSTSCSSVDIATPKKSLRSMNRSIKMNPSAFNHNQNIRNSLVINASVKDDFSAWRS